MEAIRTNVLGAENVMRSAAARGVERCVVLSTDKAVYRSMPWASPKP